MWKSKVIWSEGMFLQPQHFQQQDRYFQYLNHSRASAIAPYNWGFVSITIDESQLALGKLALASARGILPDGTPFDFPGVDPVPDSLEIARDARDDTVVLALPLLRNGAQETDLHGGNGGADLTRLKPYEWEGEDNTANGKTALIQVGGLQLRLMLASEATDAYACLAVARVTERRADNQVVLHKTHVPPMLSVASQVLLSGYVHHVHGLLIQRSEALAAVVGQPGRGGVAEIADFLLLQTVNRYEPLFAQLGNEQLLHPLSLFKVCLMLAGDLSVFGREDRRPARFPEYAHDDLENTFLPLIADLRRSLSIVQERSAFPIELQERQHGIRVAIINDRTLLQTAALVLAANAQMPAESLRSRFLTQVKIGPVDKIRDLVNLQLPGVSLKVLAVAPRQIPYHAGCTYFELERGSELWGQVERSGALAVYITGEFPGLALEFWAIRS